MAFKIKNALISAFFGSLGPFFNKQATLDKDRAIYVFFTERNVAWAIYPFDIFCIILMLWVNTISVKYKMLSYKHDGAFLGTSLIFILMYVFSAGFDFLYEGAVLTPTKTVGALMMIAGIVLISLQEESDKVTKKTNSFYELVAEESEKSDPSKVPIATADDDDSPPLIQTQETISNTEGKKTKEHESTSCSKSSSKMPSRHTPGEISNLDFIQLRKGYI
jgi:hypothetical protein